jgi:hypothetical protein
MSWNIEVMCIRGEDLDPADAVPDVFGPTDQKLGFEEASSVMRGSDLCAGRIGEWIVVIDVGCRISGMPEFLEEVSRARELQLFRIAHEPIHLSYEDGKMKASFHGLEACVAELNEPRDEKDGEIVAQDLLRQKTGLALMDQLFGAQYQVFALD